MYGAEACNQYVLRSNFTTLSDEYDYDYDPYAYDYGEEEERTSEATTTKVGLRDDYGDVSDYDPYDDIEPNYNYTEQDLEELFLAYGVNISAYESTEASNFTVKNRKSP